MGTKLYLNQNYKLNHYLVFSSNFCRKLLKDISAKSDINSQLNSFLTRFPSFPPKFLTFFTGVFLNKLGILEGGNNVC